MSAFGKVQCGYKCVAKYGDIVCNSFPFHRRKKLKRKKGKSRKNEKATAGKRNFENPLKRTELIERGLKDQRVWIDTPRALKELDNPCATSA